jgi:hypothetical protein
MSDQVKKSRKKANPAERLPAPGPGRPKGTPNKFTDLKKAFLETFEKIEKEGGKKGSKVKTLYEWATANAKNQGMFYQMISKMLPSNIDVDHSGHIDSKMTIEVVETKTK